MSSGAHIHSEIVQLFNSRQTIERLVQKLSDRATARPFPHLRVVGPTPYKGKKSHSIFTDFTQNPPHVVGYKVSFVQKQASGGEVRARTVFAFSVPRHANPTTAQAFETFTITIETDLKDRKTLFHAESDIRGAMLRTSIPAEIAGPHSELQIYRLDSAHPEHFSVPVPVKYRERTGEEQESEVLCELSIEKKIETREGFLTAEVKIKNLSSGQGKIVDFLQPEDTWPLDADLPEEDDNGVFQRESDYILPGYLLEFRLREQLVDAELARLDDRPSPALRTFNVVPLSWDRETITFADYFIGEEQIHLMRPSSRTLPQFAGDLSKMGLSLDDAVCRALQNVFGTKSLEQTHLWAFQEEAVESILRELRERSGRVTVISVRTAGGKTEGFLIPLLQYCREKNQVHGTKAFIFYPTKALANDQAKRLFRLLYFCNRYLRTQGLAPITMALYHGDIETEMTSDIDWVPFKCVRGCEVYLQQERENDKNLLRCPVCQETYDYCFVTRGDAHVYLPDIVISNPDTLTHVMTWRAERHSILGRKVKGCKKCGWTTTAISARRCQGRDGECGENLTLISPEQVPELFVYDEVHLFNGALGMNVAAFNRRLSAVLSTYAERSSVHFSPVWIGSSATIKDPDQFASVFFGVDSARVQVVPSDSSTAVERDRVSHSRYNLFLLPRAYRPKQTTSLLTKYLLDLSQEADNGFKPRILGFVNSLRDCNDLILETKSRTNTELFKIDGHNTQYTREQRSDREVRFNKGELQVLFATSTLEVGIDFEDVHALIIFSPPYHFNDYLQRIGRAGRKTDALVVTVCKSNQAIDYWYFEHAGEIIAQPDRWTHRIPIGKENLQVITKAMKLALFDCIYLRQDISDIVARDKVLTALFDRSHGSWQSRVWEDLSTYFGRVFGTERREEIRIVLETMAKRFLGFQGDFGRSLLEAVHKRIHEEESLDNLRSSERSVTVQYTFGMAGGTRN